MSKRKKTVIYDGELLDEEFDPVEWEPGLEGIGLATDQPDITPYSKVLQGNGINALIAASTLRGSLARDEVTHCLTVESNGVLITIDEQAIKDITPQTFKVLILILTKVTSQLPRANAITAEAINKGRKVLIPLSEYMKACRIKTTKEARTQLNNAINALYGVSFDWTETVYKKPDGKSRKVKMEKPYRMRLLGRVGGTETEDGKPVKRGVAEINLDFDMAEYLAGSYIMPYPDALLSINTVYSPYSISLGWKLCNLHNMNYGKKNANTTTVQTLLNAAAEIPRYSDLAKTGHIYERIIERLDKGLAALVDVGVLSTYWYFADDGTVIESGYYKDGKYLESGKLALLSYTEFSSLSVHYELKDYPDQTPRLEAKSKRIKAAISRRKTAAKKKETETEDGESE